jgi:transcription-repair coupling factor (superfamily II helicase)
MVVVDGPKGILDLVDGLESDYRTSYADELAKSGFFATPETNFLFREELSTRIARHDQLVFPGPGDATDRAVGKPRPMAVAMNVLGSEGFGRNMNILRDSLSRHHDVGREVLILCESKPHADRLREILEEAPVGIAVGSISEGFTLVDEKLAVITDHEIFGRPRRKREKSRRFKKGLIPQELKALKPGDYVVHVEHGIGVYQGMQRLESGGQHTDCLLISYTKGDKLYVPVDQLDLVQRYSAGEGAAPSVSTLGGTGWQKLKSRVKNRIKIMADELIQTYAKRRSLPGHPYPPDTPWQREMEAAFPYDETVDQLRAIEDVKSDMESERPMDRLVCGDVGFGKTEVAIRAAFKAVMDGKQVGVLVPTTLLAEQHLLTFQERMKSFPVKIEMMSRFRTAKELKSVAQAVAEGKVDILIGTHRILSKDVNFKNLGLLVVDEEQRFGVRHKESLKKLRSQVDVLTLSATPIPRTLHMSLVGARDMSTIATPPRDRQPIHTEIVQFGEEVIAEALLREADRGGQSFFVHNRVQTIQEMAVYLAKIVPELRVGVAHGQMPERLIEKVMLDFHHGEYDILLTTMIIESGLDIPSVNTILINRADAFGLAQLHQLRGRVGRSARKAHAYLLVPRDRALTETAQKRLRVLDDLEELGSGFQIALRDLEIRGAGNLLGAEQSGFIVNVGFDLYCRLLEEAVREIKGLPAEDILPVKLTTDLDAFLPDEYVPDRTEKVKLYKSLADATELAVIDEIENELRDRFGSLPEEGRRLLDLRRLRVLGSGMGITSILLRQGLLEVTFSREMTSEEVRALLRATSTPVEFSATGDHGFRIPRFREGSAAEALRLLRAVAGAGDPPSERDEALIKPPASGAPSGAPR